MKTPILFVDFDRTLFDTDRFATAVWQQLQKLHNIDAEAAKATLKDFYRYYEGDYYLYDFEAHLKSVLGDKTKQAIEELPAYLQGQNFLFEDAEAIFQLRDKGHEVQVITFGEDYFQRFKLSCALKVDFPVHIVLENKGDFLKREFPGVQGWLVDDKRNPSLPQGVTEVHLDRRASEPITRQNDTIVINSLTRVKEIL